MQQLKRAFRGANAVHYLGILAMAVGGILSAIGMGSAWLVAEEKVTKCEFYFYSRSFESSGCSSSVSEQYYKCDEGYCGRCKSAGEASLCFSVFGLIMSVITILLIIKRVLNDKPKDFAGRHLKWVTVLSALSVASFWFLSWMIFLGGCEGSLGDFESSSPHTGFVLTFLAMCTAVFSLVCCVITPENTPPGPSMQGDGPRSDDPQPQDDDLNEAGTLPEGDPVAEEEGDMSARETEVNL
mmetsp:Transcript_17008/g.32288  ORF Transcript_17008/g.32288 Transcript_17008/m.32288 type:complete len:240 (-) Transcript_17008:212-931(-)